MYKYITASLALLASVFYAMFRGKAKEARVLTELVEKQEEALKVHTSVEITTRKVLPKLDRKLEQIADKHEEMINEVNDDHNYMSDDFVSMLTQDGTHTNTD